MNKLLQKRLTSTAILVVLALACVTLISLTHTASRERIAANERDFRLAMLNELVPSWRYDNDFLNDTIAVSAPDLLGSSEPVLVYRATLNGEPVAAIIMSVAPQGYTGPIHLAVAINADGTLAGVRVTHHNETAGLGDAIELQNSPWILGFSGRALDNPPPGGWQLVKYGGAFDSFTGATITPRAVVQAIRDTLLYFAANRSDIFATSSK